jgi:uncharacterized protein
MPDDLILDALPVPLRFNGGDGRFVEADGALTVEADARTDWFLPPDGSSASTMNAPALLGDVDGDFMLSARVAVEFGATFDAGALVLYAAPHHWAKLAFEVSPDGQPMVVSVVTHGRSDDANGFDVVGDPIWLRVATLGAACAFHASLDGVRWHLVRHFMLGAGPAPAVGFEAQSPLGDGCVAVFDRIAFAPGRIRDLRDGS